MILFDIILFAKAGYTPADVREFLAAKDPERKPEQEAAQIEQEAAPAQKADHVEKPVENVDNIQQAENQQGEPAADPAKVIDYKAKYEEAQQALKLAQEANTKQPQPSETKTAQDILNECFASII